MPNRAIIVLSGNSISQGLACPIDEFPIWEAIKEEFTLSVNFNYKWFVPTVHFYSDYQFYINNKEGIDGLPLVISRQAGYYNKSDSVQVGGNVHLLKPSGHYYGVRSWEKGWYSPQLVSLFALTFAIALGCKEIFILGLDGQEINGKTHFYDEETGTYYWERHRYCGVGKDDRGYYRTSNYNKPKELNQFWYSPYKQELERGVQIFNVSPESAIDVFPKLTYKDFYSRLIDDPIVINQNKIRSDIVGKIKCSKSYLK